MIKIAFDIMWFENDIAEAITAARNFVTKYSDTKIILVGNQEEIEKVINQNDKFEVVNASEVISQTDNPLLAIRKKDSSMLKAIKMVKDNLADAVVSPGSTPCFVSISYSNFGMIENISKPAFNPTFPSTNLKGFNMLDVGANKICDEYDLVNFALMGHVYAKLVRQIENPSIKLLNIGTEDYKGLEIIQNAHKILKNEKRINYQGFIESGKLLLGETDVICTDGFTGNICLKAMEGSLKILSNEIKRNLLKPYNILGAIFSYNAFRKVKNTFDYKNYAGALVLGLNKIAIKAHGSADEKEFMSALELARNSAKYNIVEEIKKFINEKK